MLTNSATCAICLLASLPTGVWAHRSTRNPSGLLPALLLRAMRQAADARARAPAPEAIALRRSDAQVQALAGQSAIVGELEELLVPPNEHLHRAWGGERKPHIDFGTQRTNATDTRLDPRLTAPSNSTKRCPMPGCELGGVRSPSALRFVSARFGESTHHGIVAWIHFRRPMHPQSASGI